MSKQTIEKNDVITIKGILNLKDLTIEVDGEAHGIKSILSDFDGADIAVKCKKQKE
jgi:hypothetical protein